MSLPARKKYTGETRRLLLAFDIGTTFSGISYSILDPGVVPDIRPVTRYPCQEHVGGDSKIPTVIYYDSKGDPQAIGAETLKEGIEEDAEENEWTEARWFKLHLRPKRRRFSLLNLDLGSLSLGRDESESIPPLPKGKTIVQLFSDYMAYLFQCAKDYISDTHGVSVWSSLEGDIMYVLTHPNGWGGPQQAQMRQAAMTAGLVPNTEEGHGRVTFVTEGEASLHFCLSNGLVINGDSHSGVLIVDAGGGTIDLTAYRKFEDHTFEEIAIPKCYFQGAAFVTMRAKEYFKKLLRKSRFFQDVDTITTRFDRNTKHVFRRADEPHHIQFASHREKDPALNIRSGRLTLPGTEVASFFEPSISCIVQAIKDQVSAADIPIKTVFLVGGFSASSWLFESVRKGIEPLGIAVSRPDAHVNKAVSNGAVSFYLDGVVGSRVARATYGVGCYSDYDSYDPEHRKRGHKVTIHEVSGQPVLDDIFAIILEKNTRVKKTEEFRSSFCTYEVDRGDLNSKKVSIRAYCGKSDYPKWMDDEPGEKYPVICVVEADTSKVKTSIRRSTKGGIYHKLAYDIVLRFGLTELQAQIAYKEDGVEKRGPAKIIYED